MENKKEVKVKNFYLSIVGAIRDGKNLKEICQEFGFSKQRLNWYIKSLKAENLIRKVGYGTWELTSKGEQVKVFRVSPLTSKSIQLHNLSYILRLTTKPAYWDKRENVLIKFNEQGIKHQHFGNMQYCQFQKDNFLIQLFSNSIIIYNRNHYEGSDSYDLFIQALEDTLKAYNYIEDKFKFRFFNDGIPQFTIRSQHYVKLKDEIANRCQRIGNLLKVEIDGKLRAWVDFSEPFGLEFGHKNYAPEDTSKYVEFVRDIIKNNPPLNSQLAEHIINLTTAVKSTSDNQIMFDKNFQSHLDILWQLGNAVDKLTDTISKLQKTQDKQA